ncbi:hypothetical protein ACQP1O_28450 [Nocardia sp. CA-151230]
MAPDPAVGTVKAVGSTVTVYVSTGAATITSCPRIGCS